jgi:hypothetical protein
MAGPLVVRVIMALGFSVLSFAGVSAVFSTLLTMAQNNWAALPVSVMQLATLSGIPEALGLIFGAYSTRMAMWVATSGARFVLKGGS